MVSNVEDLVGMVALAVSAVLVASVEVQWVADIVANSTSWLRTLLQEPTAT